MGGLTIEGDGVAGVAMARPKKRAAKGKQEPGFRTIGIRVSHDYAAWLAEAARHDRATIAAFIDRAAADRAKAIGLATPPPERIP